MTQSIDRTGFLMNSSDLGRDQIVSTQIEGQDSVLAVTEFNGRFLEPRLIAPHEYHAGAVSDELDRNGSPES